MLTHEVCGKVIVATKRADLTLLDRLYRRGLDHRLAVTRLAPEQVQRLRRTSGASLASKFRQRESSTTGRFLRNMLN